MKKILMGFAMAIMLLFSTNSTINAATDLTSKFTITDLKVTNVSDSVPVNNVLISGYAAGSYKIAIDFTLDTSTTINDGDYILLNSNMADIFNDFNVSGITIKHNGSITIGIVDFNQSQLKITFTNTGTLTGIDEINGKIETAAILTVKSSAAKTEPEYNEKTIVFKDAGDNVVKESDIYRLTYRDYPATGPENYNVRIAKYGYSVTDTNINKWAIDMPRSYFYMITKSEAEYESLRDRDLLVIDNLPEDNIVNGIDNISVGVTTPRYSDGNGNSYIISGSVPGYSFNLMSYMTKLTQYNGETIDQYKARIITTDMQWGVYTDEITGRQSVFLYFGNFGDLTWEKALQDMGFAGVADFANLYIPPQYRDSFIESHTRTNQSFIFGLTIPTLQKNLFANKTISNTVNLEYKDNNNVAKQTSSSATDYYTFSSAVTNPVKRTVMIKNVYTNDSNVVLTGSSFSLLKDDGAGNFLPSSYNNILTPSTGELSISGVGDGRYQIVHNSVSSANATIYDKNSTIYSDGSNAIAGGIFEINDGMENGVYVFAATDKMKYTITTSVVGGTIDANATVVGGEDKTINYSPSTGYELESVTVDGVVVDKTTYANSYTFNNVTANHTIDVVYKIKTFTITTSVTGGTIDASASVNYGSNKTINYTPTTGYELKSVTVDGISQDISTYVSSYDFNNITANHTITVVYEKIKYDITTSVVGGIIDASSKVEYGNDKTINYTPTTGYELKSVTVDGIAVDKDTFASSYTFTNVKANHTIDVVYEITTFTITTSVTNGSIDASVTVNYGSNKTINYTPDTGYQVKTITVDGVDQDITTYALTYTFTNVTANHTIDVVYEKIKYNIITSVVGGSIDTSATVEYGSNLTINYAPITGYELKSITVDGVAQDITTYTSSYTFTNITANHTIAVEYQKIQYNIVTSAQNGAITNTSVVDYGDDITISYFANVGYELESVVVDGVEQNINNFQSTYEFKNVIADHTIVVKYSKIEYIIDATIKNGVGGSLKASQIFSAEYGSDKTISYTANNGYELKSVVVDGVKQDINTYAKAYTFKDIKEDHKIIVEFVKIAIDDNDVIDDPDPTPNPEKPPKTGQSSLVISLITGLMAIIGISAMSLNKRKEN